MNKKMKRIPIDEGMLELFRSEVDQQAAVLIEELPNIEWGNPDAGQLELVMRAAHSVKGAGRLVGVPDVVDIASAMENLFQSIKRDKLHIREDDVFLLLNATKFLRVVAVANWADPNQDAELKKEHDTLLGLLRDRLKSDDAEIRIQEIPSVDLEGDTGLARDKTDIVKLKDEVVTSPQSTSAAVGLPEKSPAARSSRSKPATKGALSFALDASMLELFRLEVEQHGSTITDSLLSLEKNSASTECAESLMRAAHSIKGAARLVGLQEAVELAHMMEDYLVAVREGRLNVTPQGIDVLLKSNDMLAVLAALTEQPGAKLTEQQSTAYITLLDALEKIMRAEDPGKISMPASPEPVQTTAVITQLSEENTPPVEQHQQVEVTEDRAIVDEASKPPSGTTAAERVLRISSEQLNRLMGLAGESMVEARWLRPYSDSMLALKKRHAQIISLLDHLREALDDNQDTEKLKRILRESQGKASECRHILAGRLAELESYDRRVVNLSSRLRREVVASRMRPFGDGVKGFPRMIRDLARQLGKQAQLQIDGQATMVDRDILDKIEAPLNHLLRNAIDHGIEMPEERIKAGKPEVGTIRLSAYHQAGMLSIVMEDDGRGVDIERLRKKIVERNLVNEEMAKRLDVPELMEFMFLPNFSTRDTVTDISGRGVGLDVVHDVVQEMRGMVRANSQFGKGTRFQLQLPLTLSVLPALLVEIAGEPYAFPLARIERILQVSSDHLRELEGQQYISVGDHHIGLVSAHQLLGFGDDAKSRETYQIVVVGDRKRSYGLVIDRFLGERDLVVHVLPSRLGKVRDVSSAALMEDGTPLLIFDVDDIFRSLEKIISTGRLNRVRNSDQGPSINQAKRILVVDDSITVREVERKLLEAQGYQVDVAVDGMDGWNALREGHYDLVITDIDMPRMDGIELVRLIRKEPIYQKLPIMIVSYKDREEDRIRGLEAGADYYLTKGSFHDETLRDAVVDLIGVAA